MAYSVCCLCEIKEGKGLGEFLKSKVKRLAVKRHFLQLAGHQCHLFLGPADCHNLAFSNDFFSFIESKVEREDTFVVMLEKVEGGIQKHPET